MMKKMIKEVTRTPPKNAPTIPPARSPLLKLLLEPELEDAEEVVVGLRVDPCGEVVVVGFESVIGVVVDNDDDDDPASALPPPAPVAPVSEAASGAAAPTVEARAARSILTESVNS
jgi:hypothetical protein